MIEGKPDWYPMWKELGIDIEKHDQLLAVLPDVYKKVYIDSQKTRPKAMNFFEYIVGDIHGIRIKELKEAKEEGKIIVGTFCLFVPDEIIIALNGIGIGLCGGTNFSNFAVEGLLPTNVCPLIKSALGFAFGDICPYHKLTDILIGETTCDGKKKAWEIMAKNKSIYVLETPQCKNRKQAKEHYIQELKGLIYKLEDISGKKIDLNNLKDSMRLIKNKRNQLRRVYNTRKNNPPPISGKDTLLVSQIAFYDDPNRQIDMIGKLAEELEQRVQKGIGVVEKDAKRILISGTPMAIPNWKLHNIIETNGAIVVAEETCTGTRYFESEFETIEGDSIDDLLEIIADRYLGINCACFSPNNNRLEDIKRIVKEYNVDGVIFYTLAFCQPYEFETIMFEKILKEEGIRVLSITTDYSSEDEEQLKTRIEAFLETL
ncbi:MAG: 2-hydroxyacyl-CoA dehydratase [Candidatus Lokiarchaeota archaeon]|nr:2-hydroxyacyl-CoA dehydratase [Candidatus Lokiarchaeota archaeon]